jgi:toxin-antitoxin system PIN domain toxin
MTVGVDTGVLVAVTVREHPAHAAAWRWFVDEVRGRDGAMALAPQVLAEYAHVVTDPRRFERPLSMADALAVASRWWHARECRQVTADGDAVAIFLDWMAEHRLGRKRLLDTMLAASYRAAGVSRLVTTDGRDFEVFGGFEVVRIGG